MERNLVIVSYSHNDDKKKHKITNHLEVLERQNLLELWCDRDIGAGQNWREEIDRNLQSAKVAVLVISDNFLTSDFVLKDEVPKLLDRHKQKGMHLIPVLVSDCAWQAIPWLSELEIRPREARPIFELREAQIDHELANIAREVLELLS